MIMVMSIAILASSVEAWIEICQLVSFMIIVLLLRYQGFQVVGDVVQKRLTRCLRLWLWLLLYYFEVSKTCHGRIERWLGLHDTLGIVKQSNLQKSSNWLSVTFCYIMSVWFLSSAKKSASKLVFATSISRRENLGSWYNTMPQPLKTMPIPNVCVGSTKWGTK